MRFQQLGKCSEKEMTVIKASSLFTTGGQAVADFF